MILLVLHAMKSTQATIKYVTKKFNLRSAFPAIKSKEHKATKSLTMPLVKVRWFVRTATILMVLLAQKC